MEGRREILRAVESGHPVEELFILADRIRETETTSIISPLQDRGVPVFACTEAVFEKITYRGSSEGLLAVVPALNGTLDDLTPRTPALILVAEHLEKPGNLGAILRSMDAVAADAMIVCDRSTDVSNPNVIRASLGTVFTVPVAEASTDAAFDWLEAQGIQSVAAVPDADILYTEADFTLPSALFVGSEQDGLSDRCIQRASQRVRIPMLGKADSLNVSTAATVLLYEAIRQRGEAGSLRSE